MRESVSIEANIGNFVGEVRDRPNERVLVKINRFTLWHASEIGQLPSEVRVF